MNIGFIGCGNMAKAMIRGILENTDRETVRIMASAKRKESIEKTAEELGILAGSNEETAAFADVLFLAVKPQFYEEVIAEIRDHVKKDAVIVTLAPGKTLEWLSKQFGGVRKIVRTMPNTPAMVGEGMTGVCPGENIMEDDLALVMKLCAMFGKAQCVSERLMDVVTGVSGSSPAYVFMMIEAMADGAVADGMPRAQAYEFAAQAVLGSARLMLETRKHPGELKDMVCSPGGTTIEAVRVLEDKGFRSALIEAEKACVKKSRGM
ncbi:MAG: pyrroline-5-carboxylate reductase [Lachnospiraceae bacterium]|nr:pyrroline-5-carboxylate reductase [Lachnospiraceae bacterium]